MPVSGTQTLQRSGKLVIELKGKRKVFIAAKEPADLDAIVETLKVGVE
jgi:hypothetical protein